MLKVAVLDDYQAVAGEMGPWDRLDSRIDLTVFTEAMAGRPDHAEILEPFEIIVLMRERTPFPSELIAKLPNLRQLVTTGSVNAAIDMEAAAAQGVTVSGTGAGSSMRSTLELTWALLLALPRNVVAEDRAVRGGGWQHTIGPELSGRTLVLVGLGNLGKMMVPVAHAFGMNVIVWSQNLKSEDAESLGARAVGKQELFEQADMVSVHYKLSERSVGLVGAAELGLMKPTAYLVNTSRGPLVDENALIEALRSGRIAGAGLDVYDVEPLPLEHALRSMSNTILTPHIGYVSTGAYEGWWEEVVEDIESFLDGSPVRVLAAPAQGTASD
jgi:phosphoglycerate dehydrogenase-like enzyme